MIVDALVDAGAVAVPRRPHALRAPRRLGADRRPRPCSWPRRPSRATTTSRWPASGWPRSVRQAVGRAVCLARLDPWREDAHRKRLRELLAHPAVRGLLLHPWEETFPLLSGARGRPRCLRRPRVSGGRRGGPPARRRGTHAGRPRPLGRRDGRDDARRPGRHGRARAAVRRSRARDSTQSVLALGGHVPAGLARRVRTQVRCRAAAARLMRARVGSRLRGGARAPCAHGRGRARRRHGGQCRALFALATEGGHETRC